MPFLGDTTQGSESSPGNSGRALVTKFTASENGTITGGQAYFASSSTAGSSAKLLIYQEDTVTAGRPGSLIAASSGTAVPAGGGLITWTGMSGSIVNGTSYYVGIVYSDFQANVSVDGGLSGLDTEMANGTLSYTTPPATWPNPSSPTYTDLRVNAAIEYTTGGGGTTLKRMLLLGVG